MYHHCLKIIKIFKLFIDSEWSEKIISVNPQLYECLSKIFYKTL